MTIHYDILHMLIYAVMLAYVLSAAVSLLGREKWASLGERIFAAGFCLAAAAFVLRWREVAHVPLQNLFEVFLTLGMVIYPLSLFCRKILAVSSAPVDAILGLVVLFPAGLIFKSQPQHLPPALQDWLFIPHVAAYMLAYIILAMAAAQAMPVIFSRTGGNALRREAAAYRLVSLSFPLLTIGLLLGAWWGKKAWGDYWQWDPKELWSLATWLIFLFYIHLRCAKGRRWPRLNSIIVVLGGLAVVITLLWVNLAQRFSGMHSYASP